MKIHVVAVGKVKEPQRSLAELYMKRIGQRHELSLQELEVKQQGQDEQHLWRMENREILTRIKSLAGARVFSFSPQGKQMSSEDFAAEIQSTRDSARALCLVIGGSHGLGAEVLDSSDKIISFSPMIFPHQLFRIMLLEQVYRACTIMANEPYHK